MKFLFCCGALLFCLFVSPFLGAQAYIVTEEQIKKLETILTEYKANNEKQKAELQTLKIAAAELRTESMTLNQKLTKSEESLMKEIQSTEILKENWQRYEKEKSIEIQNLMEENQKLIKKISFLRGAILATSLIIVFLSVFLFVYIARKKLN